MGTDRAVAVPAATAGTSPAGRIFETADPQFWALLAAILVKAKPDSILELGAGRSTTFLADYASRHDKPCVSFEQSAAWHRKVAEDLRCMGIEREMVFHVPLHGGAHARWYRLSQARELIGETAFDLVSVDGPQHRARRNARGQALVKHAARQARLVVVDDVHRDYNLNFFHELAQRFPEEGRFYYRHGVNRLAMATSEWAPLVRACCEFVGVDVTNDVESAKRGRRRPVPVRTPDHPVAAP